MKKLLRFIGQYIWVHLEGRAFGKTLTFAWGDDTRERAIIEVHVTGLTVGATFGIYV